jgi:putative DNA primase/helicase
LSAAIDYAGHGWAIIPVSPTTKIPLVEEWQKLGSRDEKQIRAWWRQWPNAMIGVLTGPASGFWVLDVDIDPEKDLNGFPVLEAWEREFGKLPATLLVDTPRGGRHFYFKWRDGVRNNAGRKEMRGVDWRGEGGFVIVPPSTKADGKTYKWWQGPGDLVETETAPEWLLDKVLKKPSIAERAQAAVVPPASYAPSSKRGYGAAALEAECQELASAASGSRNDQLNRSAFSLAQLVAGGELGETEVKSALFEAASACGLVQDDGRPSVDKTIWSGFNAGIQHPRTAPEKQSRPELRVVGGSAKPKPDVEPTDLLTEDSAALRFADLHKGKLLFCHDTSAWYEWVDTHWRRNKTGLAFQYARELVRDLSAEESARVQASTNRTTFAGGVERFARVDPVFAVEMTVWDQDAFLLGTPGGTVDLQTGVLRPSDPGEGLTKIAGVAPAETADCPQWLAFLSFAAREDAGLVRFIQQWCGYCLTGDTREHALVFAHGDGGNGKGVFLNTLKGILGDYAKQAAMDTFVASQNDKHPTDLADLRGARAVLASETEQGRYWAEAKLKAMTGGDVIKARFMRQDFFEYRPTYKVTIIGNHKPALRNVDQAARRRFNFVPFTRTPEKPDLQLEEKLTAEWPGILRWMIAGCLDWQANGLVRPDVVKLATDEYFADQDMFRQWFEAECYFEDGNTYLSEAAKELYAAWNAYAREAGEEPGSIRSFGDRMERVGCPRHRTKNLRQHRCVELMATREAREVSGRRSAER